MTPQQGPAQQHHPNQVNAIHTLRSGRVVDSDVHLARPILVSVSPSRAQTSILLDKSQTVVEKPTEPSRPVAPFPSCLTSKKKPTNVDKILDVFNKVQVNVPLLDIIQ